MKPQMETFIHSLISGTVTKRPEDTVIGEKANLSRESDVTAGP